MSDSNDTRAAFLALLARTAPLEPASGAFISDEDPRARRGELDLDAIEARANAATPGPWSTTGATVDNWPPGHDQPDELVEFLPNGRYENWPADAAFLAAARTDVPALVATVRAQAAALARLRAVVAEIGAAIDARDAARARLQAADFALRDVRDTEDWDVIARRQSAQHAAELACADAGERLADALAAAQGDT